MLVPNVNLQPGIESKITLTSITGVVPFFAFGIQTAADSATAVYGGLKRFIPLSSDSSLAQVQLYTANGVPILNSPVNTYMQQVSASSEKTLGQILENGWQGFIFIDFTSDRAKSLGGIASL